MLDFDITKENVRDNIASGNINPRILKQLFADMQIRSYTYDYQIQKELVNYHEERITAKDLKLDVGVNLFTDGISERIYYFPMKHQLIATGKRKEWRDSAVYNKALTFDELNENHKLFRFNVLVFVNEKLYTNVRIKAKEEFTHIYFRYRDLAKMIQTTGVNITILCIPQSVVTVVDNIDATLYNKGHFSFRLFNPTSLYELYQCESYFAFLINKETNRYIMSDKMVYMGEEEMFHFQHEHLPSDITKYKLVVIGSDLLYSISDLPADNDQFFATELENMPIPKDNISILVKNSDGLWKPNPGSVVLTEKYPNVFQVTNPEDYQLRLIVYYADDTQNDHIVYDTEMDYYLSNVNLLDAYQNGYVPTLLKEFTPMQWDYALKDYFQKNNGIHKANIKEPWTSFSYKLKTISNIIKQWSSFYLEYAKRTYGFLTGWYHDIAKWSPERLASKERMNSLADIPLDPTGREQYPTAYFKEPQYVFTYKNTNTYDDPTSYLFYIDGKMVVPTSVLVFRGYQYVYLPKKRITPTSMIEVERFDGVRFSKRLRVPEEGVLVDLSFLRGNLIANSLFIVNEAQEFANKNYKVEVIDPELGTYVLDLDTSVYNLLPSMSLKITPLFPQYNDSLISLNCNNQLVTFNRRNSGDDYSTGKTVNFNPNGPIMNVKKMVTPRLRMYTKDGRFLSKLSYVVHKRENAKSKPKFSLPVRPGETREMMIAYIGYDERLIYHLDEIPNNGLIDVEGKTNRPICLSYHDIYLNGIKLHKNDIMIISPFKFVITTLETHNTLANLEIYEKMYADDNLFKFEIDEDSLYLADRLFNEDDKFRNELIESLDKIDPDGSVEDIQFIRDWYSELLNKWLFNNQLNADTRHDLEFFAPLFDKDFGNRLLFNADDRVRYKVKEENRFYLWHDGSIRENGGENPVHEPNRFSELEGNIPNPELHMTEKEFLAKGSAPIDGNTVLDYHTELHKEPKAPQYHFPSDLDNKPNLSNLNTSADAVTVTEESYSGVERTRIGTHQPVHKVSTTEVDPKPDDVVIEPIEPEHVRMPSRIATPEPTLPEEGEYERVEETLTTEVSYGLQGIELPGLQLVVYNGRHKKQVPFGTTVESTENATVQLRYSGTPVHADENTAITIDIADEQDHVMYTYELGPSESVAIDQLFNLTTRKFALSVTRKTVVYANITASVTFGDVDPRFTNQLVAIDSKTNEIIYRFGRPSGKQEFTILENRTYRLALDYTPSLASEYDVANRLVGDNLSHNFFNSIPNRSKTYHIVTLNGAVVKTVESKTISSTTQNYAENTAYRINLTDELPATDSPLINIKSIRMNYSQSGSGSDVDIQLTPSVTIDLSQIKNSTIPYTSYRGKMIVNGQDHDGDDFVFEGTDRHSSTDMTQRLLSVNGVSELVSSGAIFRVIHVGNKLILPVGSTITRINSVAMIPTFNGAISDTLPLPGRLSSGTATLMNSTGSPVVTADSELHANGSTTTVSTSMNIGRVVENGSRLGFSVNYDTSTTREILVYNKLSHQATVEYVVTNLGHSETRRFTMEPMETKTLRFGGGWEFDSFGTIGSEEEFDTFINTESNKVESGSSRWDDNSIEKLFIKPKVVVPKYTEEYVFNIYDLDSILFGQIQVSDGERVEVIEDTDSNKFTFKTLPGRTVSVLYQFNPSKLFEPKYVDLESSTTSRTNGLSRLVNYLDVSNIVTIQVDNGRVYKPTLAKLNVRLESAISARAQLTKGSPIVLAEGLSPGAHSINSASISKKDSDSVVATVSGLWELYHAGIGNILDNIGCSVELKLTYPETTGLGTLKRKVVLREKRSDLLDRVTDFDSNELINLINNSWYFPKNPISVEIEILNINPINYTNDNGSFEIKKLFDSIRFSNVHGTESRIPIVHNSANITITDLTEKTVSINTTLDYSGERTDIYFENSTKNTVHINKMTLYNSMVNRTYVVTKYSTPFFWMDMYTFNHETQTLSLPAGWKLISVDITPEEASSCLVDGESINISSTPIHIEKENIKAIVFR